MRTLVGSFTITDDCGCCAGHPYLVVGACESLSGTAQLCGFSGFSGDSDPYDGGDPWAWEGQLRKWRTVSLSGELSSVSYEGTGCTGDAICYDAGPPGFADQQTVWSGSATLDCIGRTDTTANVTTAINSDCDTSNTTPDTYTITQNIPESSGFYSPTATLTSRTWPGPGCILETRPGAGRGSFDISGSATETLGEEQFLYDALDALLTGGSEDVVAGDSCCASTSSATLTSPQDQAPITIKGTAARVPITVFGCEEEGAPINVYIKLSQGTGEDYTEYTLEAVFLCRFPGFYYVPQPAPGEDDVCFVAAALDLAGPWITPATP